MLLGRLDNPDTSGALVGDCADVRDTADIHLLALEHPNAAGERVLVRSGAHLIPNTRVFSWTACSSILSSGICLARCLRCTQQPRLPQNKYAREGYEGRREKQVTCNIVECEGCQTVARLSVSHVPDFGSGDR